MFDSTRLLAYGQWMRSFPCTSMARIHVQERPYVSLSYLINMGEFQAEKRGENIEREIKINQKRERDRDRDRKRERKVTTPLA
jgi:hypothetical protein